MELYKELSYSVEESYSLKAVCKKILKDQNKIAYEGSLDELYKNDINTFLLYSGTDTDLLYNLEKQLGHIDLKKELISICSSTWKVSENTTGLVDPLLISFAKNSGLICRDSANIKDGRKIVGAYVRSPIAGLASWLIDFDYTALYPSIIMSCNVGPNTYVAKIDSSIAEDYIYSKDGLKSVQTIEVRYEPLKESGNTEAMTLDQFREWMTENNYIITILGSIYKPHSEELSFLYKILRYTLDSRANYVALQSQAKKEKDEELTKFYKNKQLAFKTISNSIYGVLAASTFRFFAPDLAETITLTGQEAIKFIGQHISNYMVSGDDSIDKNYLDDYDSRHVPYINYSDTDSLFIGIGDYLVDKGVL
jgi:DNA polymerase elongation subunit (family B)